jgi:hypothetical protein
MRAFWAVLGILMLAAAVYLLVGRGQPAQAPAPVEQRSQRATPGVPVITVERESDSDRSADAAAPAPAGPAPLQAPGVEAEVTPAPPTSPDPTVAEAPAEPEAGSTEPSLQAGAPAHTDEQQLSDEAREAQAILAHHQRERSDPALTRIKRQWLADIQGEVERQWNPASDAQELAARAVAHDSIWRSAYLEITSEWIAEALRQRGTSGDELEQRQRELLRGVEELIIAAVVQSIQTRASAPPPPPPAAPPQPAAPAEPLAQAQGEQGEPAVSPELPAEAGQAPAAAGDGEWLITRPDGTMLADGRYLIRGKGTAEDPYKISWEHLISAEEEYVPRQGRKEIPRRIQMLHDKHVEITGYVAFPLLMDEADELLVMLNQWDGCCLGVPPTPYDAVEVRLKNVITGNARMTSYGTLTGRFMVEPHLVGGWLVGLYLMEDAKLAPLAYGGFAP